MGKLYLWVFSSETVNLFLPFALLAANTFLPLTDSILFLKPCLFFLRLLDGWYVLFICLNFIKVIRCLSRACGRACQQYSCYIFCHVANSMLNVSAGFWKPSDCPNFIITVCQSERPRIWDCKDRKLFSNPKAYANDFFKKHQSGQNPCRFIYNRLNYSTKQEFTWNGDV